MTRRLGILSKFAALVATITLTNGFETDAGEAVFLGYAPELGPTDPRQAIAIIPRDDLARESGPQWIVLPIEIQALGFADVDAPWVGVELLLGDLKRAIEISDRTLGSLLKGDLTRGTTRTLERVPGSLTLGAAVTYNCSYVEPWGDPAFGMPAEESS